MMLIPLLVLVGTHSLAVLLSICLVVKLMEVLS